MDSSLRSGVGDGECSISGVIASQLLLLGVSTVGIRLAISGLLAVVLSSYTRSYKIYKYNTIQGVCIDNFFPCFNSFCIFLLKLSPPHFDR